MKSAVLFLIMLMSVSQQDNIADELKQLNGRWQIVTIEGDGKVGPPGRSDPKTLEFDGKKMNLGFGEGKSVSLNAGKKPKWMDLTVKEQGKEITMKAIYQVDGDQLKLCIPWEDDDARPASFETKGKRTFVFTAKRQPK